MIAQTGRRPSNLTTNGYSYRFRMRVPHDLNSCIGRSQMKFSPKNGFCVNSQIQGVITGRPAQTIIRVAEVASQQGKMKEQETKAIEGCLVGLIIVPLTHCISRKNQGAPNAWGQM